MSRMVGVSELRRGDKVRLEFRSGEHAQHRTYTVHSAKSYPGGNNADLFRNATVVETTVATLLTFFINEAVECEQRA